MNQDQQAKANNVNPADDSKTQQANPAPNGNLYKEQEPFLTGLDTSSSVKPSESAHKELQDVDRLGLEGAGVGLDLSALEQEKHPIGVQHEEKVYTPETLRKSTTLPMSKQDLVIAKKTTGNSDSKHWMAVLIEKLYKIAGIKNS